MCITRNIFSGNLRFTSKTRPELCNIHLDPRARFGFVEAFDMTLLSQFGHRFDIMLR